MRSSQEAMKKESSACPHCDKALPAGVLAGLCPACLLKQGAAGDTGMAAAFVPPAVEDLALLFPQWDILHLIGSGGMGAVYQVRQRELDRIVALKILPPSIGDRPGFAERFTLEAKALAKLNHPGIVTIHDTGKVDGLYYLLMEYVDGLNLRQLIEAGRISAREALSIVPQICDALQYAHDAGIVHRDIKPENILLDRQGRVKVADFGLAKLVGVGESVTAPASSDTECFSEAGQVMGTPQYMAPEQIQHPRDVDHRADIYSLGVVFYQMLTGELPGKSLEPPSKKVSTDVRLDEIVLRAMEKNPEHRYQQASQVKEVIETIMMSPDSFTSKEVSAMNIKFHCPHCDQKLSAEPSAEGSEVTCPNCSTMMLVPSAVAPVVMPPPVISMPPPPLQPVSIPKRAKALAIWSLALGIIGIIPVVGLSTGLIALVLGIVALTKKTTSKSVAIAGTVLGAIAALMIPFHLLLFKSTTAAVTFTAGTTTCTNNLSNISKGIARYHNQYHRYPDNLNALVKEGMITQAMLDCALHEGKSVTSDYEYSRPPGRQAYGLIVWDRFPHRSMGNAIVGRNVIDSNLQVRFITEPQFSMSPRAANANEERAAPPTQQSAQRTNPKPSPTVAPAVPKVEEELTLDRALAKLPSASVSEQRPLLVFLAKVPAAVEHREQVISAVKPLLNDVDSGALAFDVFVNWADKEQVPDLIEMLNVAPTSARGRQAMKMLSRTGDARAAEPLIAQLSNFAIARDAKAALAALGDVAKPTVLPLYHHENRGVRDAARELLRGYQATEQEINAESMKALSHENAETRRSAIEHFSMAKLTDAQRVAVAKALHPLVTDGEKWLADTARRAMKTMATKADAEFLLGLTSSTDDGARLFATDLLIELKDVRVATPLAALLQDRAQTHHAGNQLIRLGSSAEPVVLPYLNNEDPVTRKRAAEVLEKLGTSASLTALQRAAKDKDFFARVAADRAINAIKARQADANRH